MTLFTLNRVLSLYGFTFSEFMNGAVIYNCFYLCFEATSFGEMNV